jgi:zinc finger-containing ubiquitin peptidase 1
LPNINVFILSQSDFEYAAELEHEWLRQKYGMTEVKASTKAISNLDQALKQNKIDIVTYNYEKDQIEMRVNSLTDDLSTCSKELIQLIESVPLNKTTTKRILCTKCDHYASGFIDSGYGCGYRNTQMILSAVREDSSLRDVLFNNSIFFMHLSEFKSNFESLSTLKVHSNF